MEATFFIKPTDSNVLPRDPVTGVRLAAEGEEKPRSTYWFRRLRDGSVERATKPKPARKGDAA